MGLLHHVDALYGGLGGDGCAGRRVDRGRTASLTGARGARRRRRRQALHRDMSPFRGRELLAQIVQVLGVAEVEVGFGKRPAPGQVVVSRLLAGHRRPMVVMFSQRSRIEFHVTHVIGCKHSTNAKVKKKYAISILYFRTTIIIALRFSVFHFLQYKCA